ncbi:MAG: regulatory protein RecX [Bdellovibrionales bacterium]
MTSRTNNQEFTQALELLARSLAIRDHSRLELQEKLSKRFAAELIAGVMAEAERKGWLLPENEIAERAALTFQRKLKSRTYVENQLQKRGLPVPPHDNEAEQATARRVVEKKFGAIEDLQPEERTQALRYLSNRGFDESTIRMVLNAES